MNLIEPVDRQGENRDLGAGRYPVGRVFARTSCFWWRARPEPARTTIALQFLMEGAQAGEKCLYITLSETERELRDGAASHGWVAGRRHRVCFELLPPESLLDLEQQQSLLYSSDLELGETTKQIFEAVERARPSRVVLDSLSEIRLLAQSSLRYRRQILAIKHYFAKFGTTVMLLDDLTAEVADKTVHSVAHGVLRLEELAPAYGAERRRVAHHQISRREISRRLSRRDHHHRRTERVSAAGGVRIPQRLRASHDVERHRRTGPAARRRCRGRIEHADSRARGHRQIAARRSSSSSPRSRAARRRRCSCSTKSSACCLRA